MPERARGHVADHGGGERGQERGVLEPPLHHELEPEQRARDRRAENRAKTAGNARRQHLPAQRAAQPRVAKRASAKLAPICTAVPSRPALPPNKCVSTVPTSTIGAMRSGKQRTVVVNGVDDQIRAARDRAPIALVHPAHEQARHGQAVHDQLVPRAKVSGTLQGEQKQRRGRTAQHPDQRAEQQPLCHAQGHAVPAGRRWAIRFGSLSAHVATDRGAAGVRAPLISSPNWLR